jgi:hypothetical protein
MIFIRNLVIINLVLIKSNKYMACFNFNETENKF